MSPVEIRVIRRLSARANVLPVIARADSLTDDKLFGCDSQMLSMERSLAMQSWTLGCLEPVETLGIDEATKKPNANGNFNGPHNGS